MSHANDHILIIANSNAIDNYGMLYRELPKSIQDMLFEEARVLADKELAELTES